MIARFLMSDLKGNKSLFLRSTMPAAAAFLRSFLCSAESLLSSGLLVGFSNLFEKLAIFKILLTLSLINSSSTLPSLTAAYS